MTPGQLRRQLARVQTIASKVEHAMLVQTSLSLNPSERAAAALLTTANRDIVDAIAQLTEALEWAESDRDRARRR